MRSRLEVVISEKCWRIRYPLSWVDGRPTSVPAGQEGESIFRLAALFWQVCHHMDSNTRPGLSARTHASLRAFVDAGNPHNQYVRMHPLR